MTEEEFDQEVKKGLERVRHQRRALRAFLQWAKALQKGCEGAEELETLRQLALSYPFKASGVR